MVRMNNINLEPKLVGKIEGEFYVPDYQRGYRWNDEVTMLLNDIDEIPEGKNYSLQPIVVKKIDEKKYELIDGQQRLTTIFLNGRFYSAIHYLRTEMFCPVILLIILMFSCQNTY